MTPDPLALIRDHVDALAARALSDETELPDPPDLSGLTLDSGDLGRARALLEEIVAVEERLAGMRVRVRGEIEGLRRPRRETPAPAPRLLDTSV